MVNCEPKYRNLNRIQSFSEQMYPTVELFKQICQNDEYLKQELDELGYLSPPAVRKRFNPIPIDPKVSYGFMETTEHEIIFDTDTNKSKTIDFTDDSMVDYDKSSAVIAHFVDDGTIIDQAVLPNTPGELDQSVKNWMDNNQINTHWYVGYDKNKSYQIRPNWIKDPKLYEIPSVCRAQTFTIPEGKGGKLEAVSIHLANNGTVWGSWGSPLILQIWKTKKISVQKMNWNKRTKTNTPVPGQRETIAWPTGNPYNCIAETSFDPSKIEPGFVSIPFPQPPTLEEGESYALVFLSPLSNWRHCPRIGGWGRNCANSKYMQGDAFLSNNNGRTWERYGRNDLKVDYYLGRLTPSDFAFQLNIRQDSSTYVTGDHYLYLKPIHTNPFSKVTLSCTDTGDADNYPGKLLYQVSSDGRTWYDLTNHERAFSPDSEGNYPRTLFIRVKMWTTDNTKTPAIQSITASFTNVLPKEMYVRTHFYYPKVVPMLGASQWGRIFAPVNIDPTTDCKIEIIQEKQVIDHFNIITATELDEYTWIEGLDIEKITDEDEDVRYAYLIDNPSALELLREKGIYVLPWEDDEEVMHGMSFWSLDSDENKVYTPFSLTNSPAYPILECQLQPRGDEGSWNPGEWYDYTVDYTNDTIVLAEGLIEKLPVGSITFTYNPVFIQDLVQSEVGRVYNPTTGKYVNNPLVIDYFLQDFIVDNKILETRQVPLRVSPVDPLKSVILNKGTDNERELIEDTDFTVDYTKGLIIFDIISDDDYSTILSANDNLEVVYTPNLEDVGIAIGYTCKRGENTDKQVTIKQNWIEYKV